ncbi:MAG TPA: hypothetical protein VGH88_12755, partial [Streptosporangiaceae bacterium]
ASLVATHQPAGAGAAGAQAGPEPDGVAAGHWAERGGIDDDEHLAAYNAFLARLNQGHSGPAK